MQPRVIKAIFHFIQFCQVGTVLESMFEMMARAKSGTMTPRGNQLFFKEIFDWFFLKLFV